MYIIALLTATALATSNTSGEVKTAQAFQYGKFVLSMKSENRHGSVASFFTYFGGPNWEVGTWNEIDIEIVPSMEMHNTSPFSTNLIYGAGQGSGYTIQEQQYSAWNGNYNQYHTYVLEWTPDYIMWAVDDQCVRLALASDSAGVRAMSKAQNLMMNFWTPTWMPWGEGVDLNSMPWFVHYDYVEAYTYNWNTHGFDFAWRDNFDYFDTGRWVISDWWNFGGSDTMFMHNNVYVENGNLVLRMDHQYHNNEFLQ